MLKRILNIFIWTFTAIGIAALLGFARYRYFQSPVKGIELTITGQHNGSFLDYNKTYSRLQQVSGFKNNAPIGSVKIRKIEAELFEIPYLADVSAYTTIDGVVRYTMIERKPLLRIFTQKLQNFYVDQNGVVFPVSNNHSERVIVANGYIPDVQIDNKKKLSVFHEEAGTHLRTAYTLAKLLQSDSLLNVIIDQIYFNSLNEIELIPKIGDANILIGDESDLEKKLRNISGFFTAKAGSDEIYQYKSINAKFTNQIVCTKRYTP
jgi:cell division protein FtsQ